MWVSGEECLGDKQHHSRDLGMREDRHTGDWCDRSRVNGEESVQTLRALLAEVGVSFLFSVS